MQIVNEEYLRLAREKAGGVNEAALDSLVYWNNPFALKHWTMNVIELLLIAGAVMALLHALRVLREQRDASNLCLWFACVVYLLVTEVPLYFPHLLGLDIGLVFMHNEFTLGILYNQTPLYIVALYPALIYPSYVLVQNSGVFQQRYGLLLGAVCVGFIHHCFYEIFDHLGPQFVWWVWNYDNPMVSLSLASVPFSSIVVFSLTPPIVATLLCRLILVPWMLRCQKREQSPGWLVPLLLTLMVGVLIPVLNGLLPTSGMREWVRDDGLARTIYLAVVGLAALLALRTAMRLPASGASTLARYPANYLAAFLGIFLLLWLYALPDFFAGEGGESPRGTPLGSVPYVLGCFFGAAFLLYRFAGRPGVVMRNAVPASDGNEGRTVATDAGT